MFFFFFFFFYQQEFRFSKNFPSFDFPPPHSAASVTDPFKHLLNDSGRKRKGVETSVVKRQRKSDGDEGRNVGNEKRKRECRLNGEWRKAAGLWEWCVGQCWDGRHVSAMAEWWMGAESPLFPLHSCWGLTAWCIRHCVNIESESFRRSGQRLLGAATHIETKDQISLSLSFLPESFTMQWKIITIRYSFLRKLACLETPLK